MDSIYVAEAIERVHEENSSIIKYNDENALACILSIAYFSAKKNYIIKRELPDEKGFSDMVFLPRMGTTSPAMLVELKWDKSAETALDQIKNKNYYGSLKDYYGNLILVGINYNRKTKKHECHIEKLSYASFVPGTKLAADSFSYECF